MVSMGIINDFGVLTNTAREVMLELICKTICNISIEPSTHKTILKETGLEILVMIALVKTSRNSTKVLVLICLFPVASKGSFCFLMRYSWHGSISVLFSLV
jgi:hypothetical protein